MCGWVHVYWTRLYTRKLRWSNQNQTNEWKNTAQTSDNSNQNGKIQNCYQGHRKQASKQEGPSPPKANTPDVLEGKLSHARFESPNAPTAQWWLPNASISGSPAGEARATRAQTPFLVEDYFWRIYIREGQRRVTQRRRYGREIDSKQTRERRAISTMLLLCSAFFLYITSDVPPLAHTRLLPLPRFCRAIQPISARRLETKLRKCAPARRETKSMKDKDKDKKKI